MKSSSRLEGYVFIGTSVGFSCTNRLYVRPCVTYNEPRGREGLRDGRLRRGYHYHPTKDSGGCLSPLIFPSGLDQENSFLQEGRTTPGWGGGVEAEDPRVPCLREEEKFHQKVYPVHPIYPIFMT